MQAPEVDKNEESGPPPPPPCRRLQPPSPRALRSLAIKKEERRVWLRDRRQFMFLALFVSGSMQMSVSMQMFVLQAFPNQVDPNSTATGFVIASSSSESSSVLTPWRSLSTAFDTQIFLLDSFERLHAEFGVTRLPERTVQVQERLKQQMQELLCRMDNNNVQQNISECKHADLEVVRCITCHPRGGTTPLAAKDAASDGDETADWYSAVSYAGSVAGLFNDKAELVHLESVLSFHGDRIQQQQPSQPSIDDNSPFHVRRKAPTANSADDDAQRQRDVPALPVVILPTRIRIDIGVPFCGKVEMIHNFAKRLGKAISDLEKLHRTAVQGKLTVIEINLLVTRCPQEMQAPADELVLRFRLGEFAKIGSFKDLSRVSLVPLNRTGPSSKVFNRGEALNALHQAACNKPEDVKNGDCRLAILDVDMQVNPTYFHNVMAFTKRNVSAYFPICWNEFNPAKNALVDNFYRAHHNGRTRLPEGSIHKGNWRTWGFGMYAIHGMDAKTHLYQAEKFRGWGGEDNDFFQQVGHSMHIIRKTESGLKHIWHPKICQDSSYVSPEKYYACMGSNSRSEGGALAMYLSLQEQQQGPRSIGKPEEKRAPRRNVR